MNRKTENSEKLEIPVTQQRTFGATNTELHYVVNVMVIVSPGEHFVNCNGMCFYVLRPQCGFLHNIKRCLTMLINSHFIIDLKTNTNAEYK